MGRSFREFKEHNVRAGLGTALCYRLSSETKYHILAPVESLPAVFGTPDTIEYSSTTNRNVTNVMGKIVLKQLKLICLIILTILLYAIISTI